MATNYSNWTVNQLKKEIIKIQKAIKTKEARDKKAALAKIKAVAKKSGFDLSELVGAASSGGKKPTAGKSKKKAKARGTVEPKYKNPAIPTETWSGRGRQPVWVKEHINGGGTLENIAIK